VIPTLAQRLARSCAVLTVDVQRAFFADDGSYARLGHDPRPMQLALPRVAALHGRARAAGVPLVHVRTHGVSWSNWPRHVAPPAILRRYERARPPPPAMCAPGTPDAELAQEAEPRAGEPLITKHTYDAFFGTPLESALRRLGVETLVIAGLTTECCVSTTAGSALCRGYAVVVASDAVATPDPEVQRVSLGVLAEHVGFVASVDEIAAAGGWP